MKNGSCDTDWIRVDPGAPSALFGILVHEYAAQARDGATGGAVLECAAGARLRLGCGPHRPGPATDDPDPGLGPGRHLPPMLPPTEWTGWAGPSDPRLFVVGDAVEISGDFGAQVSHSFLLAIQWAPRCRTLCRWLCRRDLRRLGCPIVARALRVSRSPGSFARECLSGCFCMREHLCA